jgi:hypothetical protein
MYLFDRWIGILGRGPDGGVEAGALGAGSLILIPPEDFSTVFLVEELGWRLLFVCRHESLRNWHWPQLKGH